MTVFRLAVMPTKGRERLGRIEGKASGRRHNATEDPSYTAHSPTGRCGLHNASGRPELWGRNATNHMSYTASNATDDSIYTGAKSSDRGRPGRFLKCPFLL